MGCLLVGDQLDMRVALKVLQSFGHILFVSILHARVRAEELEIALLVGLVALDCRLEHILPLHRHLD